LLLDTHQCQLLLDTIHDDQCLLLLLLLPCRRTCTGCHQAVSQQTEVPLLLLLAAALLPSSAAWLPCLVAAADSNSPARGQAAATIQNPGIACRLAHSMLHKYGCKKDFLR